MASELSRLIEDQLRSKGLAVDDEIEAAEESETAPLTGTSGLVTNASAHTTLMGALRVEARVKEQQQQKHVLTCQRMVCVGGGIFVTLLIFIMLVTLSRKEGNNEAMPPPPRLKVPSPRSIPRSPQSDDAASAPPSISPDAAAAVASPKAPASSPVSVPSPASTPDLSPAASPVSSPIAASSPIAGPSPISSPAPVTRKPLALQQHSLTLSPAALATPGESPSDHLPSEEAPPGSAGDSVVRWVRPHTQVCALATWAQSGAACFWVVLLAHIQQA